MSAIHQFKCDKCFKIVNANYNGEHWLPPKDWNEIHDSVKCEVLGHLCQSCTPKALKLKIFKGKS